MPNTRERTSNAPSLLELHVERGIVSVLPDWHNVRESAIRAIGKPVLIPTKEGKLPFVPPEPGANAYVNGTFREVDGVRHSVVQYVFVRLDEIQRIYRLRGKYDRKDT